MSEITPDQSKQQHDAEKEARLQYVDDLVGPGDYWISITDAARVTRTSEAMARRWVTSGRLPIKREPVGLNQRTRMVRASDLQKIRTIIDPSAAITDDVRKIDLLSIPRQQQQIVEEQQRIVRLVEESNAALAIQEARMQEQATMLHEEIANEGLRVERGIEGQMQPLRDGLAAQEQALARLQEETRQALATLRVELKRHQDEELEKLRQEVNAAIEYRASNIDKAIQTLERDVAKDSADFTQKLERYDQQFEQVRMNIDANRGIALGCQKRADHQDEQIANLNRQLEGEALARQVLSARIEGLTIAEKQKPKVRKKVEK